MLLLQLAVDLIGLLEELSGAANNVSRCCWRNSMWKFLLSRQPDQNLPGCTQNFPSSERGCTWWFGAASSTESARCPCRPAKERRTHWVTCGWWKVHIKEKENPLTWILSEAGWLLFNSPSAFVLSLFSSFSFSSKSLIRAFQVSTSKENISFPPTQQRLNQMWTEEGEWMRRVRSSSPASWECSCQCSCPPSRTWAPPPPSRSPTWWRGRSPRWCSEGRAADSRGCWTFSVTNSQQFTLPVGSGFEFSSAVKEFYLQAVPLLLQDREAVPVTLWVLKKKQDNKAPFFILWQFKWGI